MEESKLKSSNNKRDLIQWIAFGIIMLTLILKMILFITEIAYKLTEATMDIITWTGFTIGVVLILISYLFPKAT